MSKRAIKTQDRGSDKSVTAAAVEPTSLPTGLEGMVEGADEDLVTLALSDLIEDANGEIVLFNDSHLRRLALLTEANELARGEAPHHVTAAGEDVTGFRYVTFDNGITLYYQPDLELLVLHERS